MPSKGGKGWDLESSVLSLSLMCYVTLYKSSRLNTKFPLFVVFTHTITSRGPNIWSTCSINGVEGTASCSDASIFPTQKTSTHSSRPVSHITLAECLPGDSKSYLGLSTLPSITVWNSVSYLSYSCEPLHFNMLSKSVIAFLDCVVWSEVKWSHSVMSDSLQPCGL